MDYPPRNLRSESGAMLMIAMNVVVILLALASAFLTVALADSQEHGAAQARVKAFYIAEAGLNAALADVRGGGTGVFGDEENPIAFNHGSYLTTSAQDGDLVTVIAIGRHGNEVQAIEGVIDVGPGGGFYEGAAGGDEEVLVLDAAATDSYDASAGTYLSQKDESFKGKDVADGKGHVESNGDISVGPGAIVYGDAEVGAAGETLTGSERVSGMTSPASVVKVYEPVVKPDLSTVPTGPVVMTTGAFTVGSATYDLPSIDLSGSAVLTVIGPATIVVSSVQVNDNAKLLVDDSQGPVFFYVTDKLNLAGPGVEVRSLSKSPKSVLFFNDADNYSGFETTKSGDPARPTQLAGSAIVFGVIYAPNGTVSIKDHAKLHGSAYGKKIVIQGDSCIHFDENLGGISTLPSGTGDVATGWTDGPGGYGGEGGELVSWRTVAPQLLEGRVVEEPTAGSNKSKKPGSNKPKKPGSNKPKKPGSNKPKKPGSNKPKKPGSNKPKKPGSNKPKKPESAGKQK